MTDWIAAVLLVGGAAFIAVAALGLARMSDVYTRLQTASKAATLGVGGILLAVAVQADAGDVRTRALLGIAFFFLTIPVSAFLLARASYRSGVAPGERTTMDELAEALGGPGESWRRPRSEDEAPDGDDASDANDPSETDDASDRDAPDMDEAPDRDGSPAERDG